MGVWIGVVVGFVVGILIIIVFLLGKIEEHLETIASQLTIGKNKK